MIVVFKNILGEIPVHPDSQAELRKQFNFLFDVDEEAHKESYEGTIPQALMLMNGRSVNQTTRVGRQGAGIRISPLNVHLRAFPVRVGDFFLE